MKNNVNDIEFYEKFRKKQGQDSYKEILDNQIKVSKQRRSYGNMTGVEKSLNKDDLVAWKNYDHNAYALIPGLNSSTRPISKKILSDKMVHKKERSFDDEINRMNQFGLTRDVRLAKDPNYQAAHMGSPPKRNPHTQSVQPSRSGLGSAGGRSMDLRSIHAQENVSTGEAQNLNHSDIPDRSLLRSGHRKYPNHHLYSNYNPINGVFGQTSGAGNNKMFVKAGNNSFL